MPKKNVKFFTFFTENYKITFTLQNRITHFSFKNKLPLGLMFNKKKKKQDKYFACLFSCAHSYRAQVGEIW